jgi:cysteine-rich repeat protein
VDLRDYAALAGALGGPKLTPQPPVPECVTTCLAVFDFDHDTDVDLADAAAFQVVFTVPPQCGNGRLEAGEECDAGGESATCDVDCTLATCGDGTVNVSAGEECDDAGGSVTCDPDCTVAECGDGTLNVDAGEECDDGGESSDCDADCTQVTCGDGTLNVSAGEECDDGNTIGGDGCSADCRIDALPDCMITFDPPQACPSSTVSVCGAYFSGPPTLCAAAPEDCFDSGTRARRVPGGLIITLAGEMNRLNVYFAGQSGWGQMVFFDAQDDVVDEPLLFSRPVRSVEVNALDGQVWIDSFQVNPGNER